MMKEPDPETLDVLLPFRHGFAAVGEYRPGVVYTVPAEEARRLMRVKRFVLSPARALPDTDPHEPDSED